MPKKTTMGTTGKAKVSAAGDTPRKVAPKARRTLEPTGKPDSTSAADIAASEPDYSDLDPRVNEPGFRLVQAINFEMVRRGISDYAQVSMEMGFVEDTRGLYVQRMQMGHRSWTRAGLERLRMVAAWLNMAPLEVMMLADVITIDDSPRETLTPDQLDRRVAALAADPEYGKLMPHFADFTLMPPWVKILLLMLYDDINRFRLHQEAPRAGIPKEAMMLLARRLPK